MPKRKFAQVPDQDYFGYSCGTQCEEEEQIIVHPALDRDA